MPRVLTFVNVIELFIRLCCTQTRTFRSYALPSLTAFAFAKQRLFPLLLSSSSLSWRFGFISYHSLKGLSTSQVHTSPFEILRRVSKIQRHFSGKSKSSLLSGGVASGAFARRKTDCDLGCDLWWMRRPFSNAESVRSNACFMQPACSETHTPPPLSSRAQATTIRVPPAHT